jgi:transposase
VCRLARRAGLLGFAGGRGRRGARRVVAVDSTGFALTHCSVHYRHRRGARARPGFAKLTACCDVATHFIVSALATRGPTYDSPQFGPVVRRAAAAVPLRRVLADAGYDAEGHHTLCTRGLGAECLIAVNARGARRIGTPQRRRVAARLAGEARARRHYGQRWQAESCFSRHKRLTGDALRARRDAAQRAELLLRVFTHNALLLHAREGIQQSILSRESSVRQ